jgi:hypothetical protein
MPPTTSRSSHAGHWADPRFTRHAFVCVRLKRAAGVKEDCYGFYPRRATAKALVGGPGVVDSEFNFEKQPPGRLSNVKASVTKAISVQDRTKILAFIRAFDKHFSLNAANCVLFADGVAKLARLKTPVSTNVTTPLSYVEKLSALNPGT